MMRIINKVRDDGPRPKLVGVYLLIHPDSGKVYVGSSKDILHRVNRHMSDLTENRHPNYKLQRAFLKNQQLLVFYVICIDREHAFQVEQELLDEGLPQGFLFNLDDKAAPVWGKGHKPSEMTIKKVKEANTGKKKSIESIEKIRRAKLGVPRPQWVKDKQSAKMLGRKMSAESRLKMSQQRKGVKQPARTAEHIRKIVEAKKGYRHSPETISRIRSSAINQKPVSIDGTIYPSASEAARDLGIDHKTVRVRIASDKEQYKDWYYIPA